MKVSDLPKYWKVIMAVVGLIAAGSIIPYRLQAVEKTQEVQSKQIGELADWAEVQQKIYDFEVKAPDGFVWSKKEEKYVPDPSYRKPSEDENGS